MPTVEQQQEQELQQQQEQQDMPVPEAQPPTEEKTVLHYTDLHNTLNKAVRVPKLPKSASQIRKWPSILMFLISECDDDEWLPVQERIRTHPEELSVIGKTANMTVLHAACIRYPPLAVVKALLEAYPANAMAQNTSGESPLHMSSYSASDDVQAALLAAAPESAALADAYGDTPLHFAARAGATFGLLQSMVHAAPHALQKANRRGVTPFWALPRSFLEAASLHEILRDDQEEQEEQEDNEESYEYRHDWDAMVLFLRYSYFGKERAAAMMAQEEEAASAAATKHEDVAWLVHAAASTPACPRQVLAFLCRMFPAQALQLDHQGHTPLQLAVRAPVLIEPTDWDEWEDGFGEQRDLPTGELQIESQVLSQSQVANPSADVDFLQQLQSTKSAESELESSAQENRAVVQILLEWSPKSVLVRDAQGRLPLTSALAAGQCFETVRTLIAAYPAALSESDPVTRLGHMEVAALHSPDLSSVYALIRALPTGVKGATRRRQTVSSTEAKAKRSHVASSLDGAATSDTKRRLLA